MDLEPIQATAILEAVPLWVDVTGGAIAPTATGALTVRKNGALLTSGEHYAADLSAHNSHGQLLTVTLATALVAGDVLTVALPMTFGAEADVFRHGWQCFGDVANLAAALGKVPKSATALPDGQARWSISGGQAANVTIGPHA